MRRRWRQSDVAARAGVSRGLVSLLERGHLDSVSLGTLRRVAAVLEDLSDRRRRAVARWALDRMLSLGHSQLAESVVRLPRAGRAGSSRRKSPSPSTESGASSTCWRSTRRAVACWSSSRRRSSWMSTSWSAPSTARPGWPSRIAAERGWQARSVSRWVVVSRSKTNQRRIDAHRAVLRAAYPSDGRSMRAWLGTAHRVGRGAVDLVRCKPA